MKNEAKTDSMNIFDEMGKMACNLSLYPFDIN
jgi:hypothetical protein